MDIMIQSHSWKTKGWLQFKSHFIDLTITSRKVFKEKNAFNLLQSVTTSGKL